MLITLKMKIQDQDFDLVVDVTMKACRIYRQQFGRDIIKDMTEIYRMVNPSIYDMVDMSEIQVEGKTEDEVYQEVMRKVYPEYKKHEHTSILDYEHTEQASQIIWAYAKNANEALPNFEEWIDSFDFILPVKEIITSLYQVWNETAKPIIEIKN